MDTTRAGDRTRGLIAFLVLLVLGGCADEEEVIRVSLRSRRSPATTVDSADGALRIGIGAMISPAATIDLYGRLIEEIGRHAGTRAMPVQRGSYAEVNDLLEQRRLDCALVCTGAFLVGRREFGMEVLVVPLFGGRPTYNSIIIVREGSPIRTFADLQGRTFAFVDPLSNTGRFYPLSRILDLGGSPEEFFRSQYTHAHDRSIRAVSAGVVDGAAVDELIYAYLKSDQPAAVEGLRILERSPPYGAPPVVVHPQTSPDLRDRLREAFLTLPETERGREILAGLGIERFVVPPVGLYASAAALEERVRRVDQGSEDR